MSPLFILGTGGQARDIADIADVTGFRPIFVTRDPATIELWSRPEEIVLEDVAVRSTTEAFALGIGDNHVRATVAKRLRGSLHFPSLIHPDASLGRGSRAMANAAVGAMIFAGARLTNNVSIGDFVTINVNATMSHDVELGDFANVSPGANIAGNVRIGEGVWIGVGAAVNQGSDGRKLEIGAWAVIGSGAVVTVDCDAGSVYVGVPARKIR